MYSLRTTPTTTQELKHHPDQVLHHDIRLVSMFSHRWESLNIGSETHVVFEAHLEWRSGADTIPRIRGNKASEICC